MRLLIALNDGKTTSTWIYHILWWTQIHRDHPFVFFLRSLPSYSFFPLDHCLLAQFNSHFLFASVAFVATKIFLFLFPFFSFFFFCSLFFHFVFSSFPHSHQISVVSLYFHFLKFIFIFFFAFLFYVILLIFFYFSFALFILVTHCFVYFLIRLVFILFW